MVTRRKLRRRRAAKQKRVNIIMQQLHSILMEKLEPYSQEALFAHAVFGRGVINTMYVVEEPERGFVGGISRPDKAS